MKQPSIPKNARYVIDGGALLHRIPWIRGSTFLSILKSYADYVIKKYGKSVVVFDGYVESSTKDMAHKRRNKGRVGLSVSFTKETTLTVSKELFLNNSSNKQRFIQFLADHLTEVGCSVVHARSDADIEWLEMLTGLWKLSWICLYQCW